MIESKTTNINNTIRQYLYYTCNCQSLQSYHLVGILIDETFFALSSLKQTSSRRQSIDALLANCSLY